MKKFQGWIEFGTMALFAVGLNLLVPLGTLDGMNLALPPAVIGAAIVGGALIKGLGSGRPKFTGYKPSRKRLQYYEGREAGDIESLYEGRPYDTDPTIGYAPHEVEARFGQRTDELAAAGAGLRQRVTNRFRGGAAAGMLSGSYGRSLQRTETGIMGMKSDIRRKNILAQAGQRREDFRYRAGRTTGAYQYGTGLMNRFAAGKYQADLAKAQAKAKFFDQLGGAVGSLGAGGAGGGPGAFTGRHGTFS